MSFEYDPSNENLNSNGNLESTYIADLRTDYGDVAVELDLSRRPAHFLAEGESIQIDLENEIITTFLQVPLALRYGLQKGKFNISMSAGILLSALQYQKIELPEKRSRHPRLHPERTRVRGDRPMLDDKIQYAAKTGVQIAYSPTTTIDFYVAPTYSLGLNPVMENDQGTIYLTQANIEAGVNVRF